MHYTQKNEGDEEPSEISQCQSSRIVKSSAVELLDEVLESQSNKPSMNNSTSRYSVSNDNHRLQNRQSQNNSNKSAVSFQEFDFWTSTINTPSNSSKIVNEIRNKSTSEYRTSKNTYVLSPQTTKNAYTPDFNYGSNMNNNSTGNINLV